MRKSGMLKIFSALIFTLNSSLTFADSRKNANQEYVDSSVLVKSLFQDVKLNEKEVTLGELASKFSSPSPIFQNHLHEIALQVPNYKIKPFRVTSFKDSDGRIVTQLTSIDKDNSLVIAIYNNPQVFMKMNGVTFTHEDMQTYEVIVEKVTLAMGKFRDKQSGMVGRSYKTNILPYAQFKQLSKPEKVKYIDLIKKNLVEIENIHNSFGAQSPPENNTAMHLYHYFFTEAVAADISKGHDCILAGNTVKYGTNGALCGQGQTSQFKGSNCGAKQVVCNTTFFADSNGNEVCVNVTNDATRQCYLKSQGNLPASIAKNSDLKKEDYADFVNKMDEQLKTVSVLCTAVQGRPDQRDACDALKSKIAELNMSCESFESKYNGKFGKIKCADMIAEAPAPAPAVAPLTVRPVAPAGQTGGTDNGSGAAATGPTLGAPGTQVAPAPTIVQVQPAKVEACESTNYTQKTLECIGGTVKKNDNCAFVDAGNKQVMKTGYRCDCSVNGDKVFDGEIVVACNKREKAEVSKEKDKSDSKEERKKKRDSQAWMQTWGVIGVGVFSALLMGYAQRQQQKSQNEWIDYMLKTTPPATTNFTLPPTPTFRYRPVPQPGTN